MCVLLTAKLVYSFSETRWRPAGSFWVGGGWKLLLLFIMGCNIRTRAVANDKQDGKSKRQRRQREEGPIPFARGFSGKGLHCTAHIHAGGEEEKEEEEMDAF